MRAKFMSVEMKKAQEQATKIAMEKFMAEGGKVTKVMEGVNKWQVNRALLDAGLAYESRSFGKPIVEVKSSANPEDVRSVVEHLYTPVNIMRRLSNTTDAIGEMQNIVGV